MRLRGNTSPDDWNPITLLDMMLRRECWHANVSWKEWRLQFIYDWYDGPIWQWWVGPLCVWIAFG